MQMKLLRVGAPGSEIPAVLMGDGLFLDVSVEGDFTEEFFRSGKLAQLPALVDQLLADGAQPQPLSGQRIGAPIGRPHQIVCIGLNYADHAAETGQDIPSEPIIFTKSPNTLVGPNDSIRLPKNSHKTDWEVELGIVIGSRASYLADEEDGMRHIAGYMVCNDVSEREFQIERQGQWSKGKSCETFNPAGPWLVTADEVPDPTALSMELSVNGATMQSSSTRQMVYTPGFLVHYLSQFMVLEPGDVINTGTPPGVGMGSKPPKYLHEGDVVELHIEGLGSQRQTVIGPR
jgi:2,4-diketo-3-deoxy-L-fuconate hydrolase|tara:strand:- start:2486 stop:3352 length:867 start_codon:yes stop_codon:yes gene_type:complete